MKGGRRRRVEAHLTGCWRRLLVNDYTNQMSTIAENILAWKEKKLNGTELMRTLVSYPHWSIPISESAAIETLATNHASRLQYNRDPKGVNRLMAWSSNETYATYAKGAHVETQQHIIDCAGSWLFSLPLEGIDEIWIDPLNAHDILYTKEQFPRLKEFAGAVAIEKDIVELRAGNATDGACIRVREYQKFFFPLAQGAGGRRLLLAPDDQGRVLAAIFTSSDTFDAFMPDAEKQAAGDQVVSITTNGHDLFTMLSKMDLTGMVFNCAGPIKPVAFAAGFSQVVLEA